MIFNSQKRSHTNTESSLFANLSSDVVVKGKKIKKNDAQNKHGKSYLSTTDHPTSAISPTGKGQRTIATTSKTSKTSTTSFTDRLSRSPVQLIHNKEFNCEIQKKEFPMLFQCQKINAPNVRGSQDTIITGYIDSALIEKINRDIITATGIPDHNKPLRRAFDKDTLHPTWEAYLAKELSSQSMYVCHGDAGLIRSWPIPMPGEEPDREIVAAAHRTIIQLINTIHTLNPDIKKYFGVNALRLTALNYYFHHPRNSENKSLTDFCLNWHVDKTKVGQLVACINLAGKRTLKIQHNNKVVEIESNRPGHFYLFDGTQFKHAVQLTSAENSMALVLRSPYPDFPKCFDIHNFYDNVDIFLPNSAYLTKLE